MPKAKRKLCRALKILFCPDCGKRFANETRVLQHMNQPSIVCGSWVNDLSRLRFQLRPPAAPNGTDTHAHTAFQFPGPDNSTVDDADRFGDSEDAAYGPVDEYPDHTATPVVDSHPNTPSIYPGGTTFVDQFSNDQYAAHREENLYYPFASREDWQLASWLLHSRLSMAAIDELLSLQLVCSGSARFIRTNLFVRSNSFLCLFDRPGSYASAQKCCHLVPAGNHTSSILGLPQNAKSCSTIVIQWNVSRLYSVTPCSHPIFLSSRRKFGRLLHGWFVSTRSGCPVIMPGIYR